MAGVQYNYSFLKPRGRATRWVDCVFSRGIRTMKTGHILVVALSDLWQESVSQRSQKLVKQNSPVWFFLSPALASSNIKMEKIQISSLIRVVALTQTCGNISPTSSAASVLLGVFDCDVSHINTHFPFTFLRGTQWPITSPSCSLLTCSCCIKHIFQSTITQRDYEDNGYTAIYSVLHTQGYFTSPTKSVFFFLIC